MTVKDEDVARDPWRGVYLALRDAIVTGEYPPGTRLVEQQLADRFGTSRGPIRTALQELERSSLVTSRDRRGTFVRATSEEDIEEIVSLWKLLYGFAARRAVERMGPGDRAWIQALRARIPVQGDPEEFLEFGMELARELLRIAHHGRVLEIFESLIVQAQARSIFYRAMSTSGHWPDDAPDYEELCDDLLRGDAEALVTTSDRFLDQFAAWSRQRPDTESTAAS